MTNILIYSPLEQFEFFIISLFPKIQDSLIYLVLENSFFTPENDQSNLIQDLFVSDYSTKIDQTFAITLESGNRNIIEELETNFIIEIFQDKINTILNNFFIIGNQINDLVCEDLEDYQSKIIFNPKDWSFLNIFWLNAYNSITVVIILFIGIFIIFNLIRKNIKFLNVWIYIIDLFFGFLLQTFISLADKRLVKFFPIFCVFFIFIFLANLTALVPFSFCLTSNLWFTLTLSLSVWISVTLLAILVRGLGFFKGFVPSNVPAALKGFITVIEIISYLARAVSLGVRIFANMLAGHSLVHILSDLVETCVISFDQIYLKIFGIFPAIILTFILFIEFGICFLQALVFVILTAIYLNEAFGYAGH